MHKITLGGFDPFFIINYKTLGGGAFRLKRRNKMG